MASLSLKHIYKVYPNGAKAVNDFNMEIEDKEFIVFVGPSGCGKSTTLRMIAGLEDITAGELRIGDRVVNDMEPKDRDIAMVFQNYALYPHMTVYDNIAFGLMMQKVPKDVIHERVLRAAEILGITEYLGRKPKEMSGGQRQRVSLGRAIVREPKVMLLDEPLSNLDAKLRTQMRTEISKLHKQLNTTFIYVTHDQVEAMTMGTRIVVMKNGFVQQIDTPKNLYKYPANKFVAGFIGTPQMNFFEGTLMRKGDVVEIAFEGIDTKLTAPYSYFHKAHPDFMKGDRPICLGLRSENVSLDPSIVAAGDAIVQVKVSNKEELGNETLVYGNLVSGEKVGARIVIKTNNDVEYETDEVISVALDLNNLHLFSSETEERILPRIPECNYIDCKTEDGKISACSAISVLPSSPRPSFPRFAVSSPRARRARSCKADGKIFTSKNRTRRKNKNSSPIFPFSATNKRPVTFPVSYPPKRRAGRNGSEDRDCKRRTDFTSSRSVSRPSARTRSRIFPVLKLPSARSCFATK